MDYPKPSEAWNKLLNKLSIFWDPQLKLQVLSAPSGICWAMPPRISTWCRTKAASASNLVDIVDSSLKHIVCAQINVNECHKSQMCQWMPTKQHDHMSKLLGVQQVILGKLLESWTCRKVCIWRVDVVSKPATNHVYNSSSAFKHDIRWYFHSTLKHQGQYKESYTSLTRKGSTMKGNFSQQKFSRSHFLMHSSRFVPLRWHCWCCQSVNGNVRFHRSTMAWPCVLSWLPRVAKAISWERLVDRCPFALKLTVKKRNRSWTNKSEAATNSDTFCASKKNHKEKQQTSCSNTPIHIFHIQNNKKNEKNPGMVTILVDVTESWHDVDWLPVWIATIEVVPCCPSCPNSHQRPSTPAAWWACRRVAVAEHLLPTHLSCWFGFSFKMTIDETHWFRI